MKFRFRIVALSVSCILLLVCYVAWVTNYSNSLIASTNNVDRRHAEFSVSQRMTTFSSARQGDQWTLKYIQNDETCLREYAADIKTGDILEAVDANEHAISSNVRTTTPSTVEDLAKGLPLKIIVVPHSHSDPGWLNTIDGYFTEQTKPTLDNMLEKLQLYPNMTFVWAETVFLQMWWTHLSSSQQAVVHNLIKRGQLEIVGGGWVVPDEANPHYFALIDQMIEGHLWLKENLGIVPRNTWSLDPFGYSAVLPYLYKRAGFSNCVILRVHTKVKDYLQNKQALEFYWQPSWNSDNRTGIMTLMMPYMLYNIKHSCGPDHDICVQFDFRKISGEVSEARAEVVHSGNVDRLAKLLLGQYQKKARLFRHNVVLIPLGDDFRYDRDIEWDQQFKNYMQLFNHMNRKKEWNVQARFGTIQDYFVEVKNAMTKLKEASHVDSSFPTLSGDFFPYTDHDDEYWTGYFSTRPFGKSLSRNLEVFLRSAEILHSLASSRSLSKRYKGAKNYQKLTTARRSLALYQHHDGITGTSRSFVTDDYLERLTSGLFLTRDVIRAAAGFLLSGEMHSLQTVKVFEPLSARMLFEQQHIVHVQPAGVRLELFNNIAQSRHELVHLAVNHQRLLVVDHMGHPVVSQIGPLLSDGVTEQEKNEIYTLSFLAELPPLGIISYHILIANKSSVGCSEIASVSVHNTTKLPAIPTVSINGSHIKGTFSRQTGLLESLEIKTLNLSMRVHLSFMLYTSHRSGAYIFAPEGPATKFALKQPATVQVITGPLFSEVRFVSSHVTHVARIISADVPLAGVVELTNIVDISELDEKEIIMRIETSVKSGGVFYTDQNGFRTVRRKRFSRLPREANYYPATSSAYIQDKEVRLSLIMSQPFGMSSLADGSLDVMLDRRLLYDDKRGLGEGVVDNKRAFSQFYLLLEKASRTVCSHSAESMPSLLVNVLTNHLRNQPVLMLSASRTDQRGPFLPLESAFSCDTLLVNLRAMNDHAKTMALIVHKLGYRSDYHFDSLHRLLECKSQSENLVIGHMFSDMRIKHITEMSLSFLHKIKECRPEQNIVLDPMALYSFKIECV